MRREIELPTRDTNYLNATERPWETLGAKGRGWVLMHDFPVPPGYTVKEVIAAVQIPAGYDDTQIDMVYFYPPLVRTDGKAIGALTQQTIDQKVFQRWSRHRTSSNPWRPGVDYVGTHMELVDDWLEREFRLHP
jgi:hypothetical protein